MAARSEKPEEIGRVGDACWRFVLRFVDRACVEGGLDESQRVALHANLAEVITMQIQMLEAVHGESRRVPVRARPRLDALRIEHMWPGERVLAPTPLRCQLLADGREMNGAAQLVPAEGALFLTNYRLVFRGYPMHDPLVADALITRSMPVAALLKAKRVSANNVATSVEDETASTGGVEVLQMRSATFQLLKCAFDPSVSSSLAGGGSGGETKLAEMRGALSRARYPQSVLEFFFCSSIANKHAISTTWTTAANPALSSSSCSMSVSMMSGDSDAAAATGDHLLVNNTSAASTNTSTTNGAATSKKEKHTTDAIR